MSDASAIDTVSATVLPKNSASANAEADRTRAGDQPGVEGQAMVKDVNPKMHAGEHIERPPSIDNNVPIVCLITSCTGSGNLQQQSAAEDQGAADPSSGGILVTPPNWQHAIPTELIDDPMLSSATLMEFQTTFKKLYKFSMVSDLY
jgi:hypothetical protein